MGYRGSQRAARPPTYGYPTYVLHCCWGTGGIALVRVHTYTQGRTSDTLVHPHRSPQYTERQVQHG